VSINDGEGDEAWELKHKQDSEELKVYSEIDKDFMKKYGHHRYYKDEKGEWQCSGECGKTVITYEIFVPEQIELSVNTYSGDIDLLGLSGDIYAKSLSGFVDMNWNDQQAASVTLKSISGEVYSNLDLNLKNLKKNPYVGYALKGTLKGGGTKLHLESISNNVYFRKR